MTKLYIFSIKTEGDPSVEFKIPLDRRLLSKKYGFPKFLHKYKCIKNYLYCTFDTKIYYSIVTVQELCNEIENKIIINIVDKIAPISL